ncbi:MAG: hypothetical protein ACYCZ2_04570 [Lutibacter sp.]
MKFYSTKRAIIDLLIIKEQVLRAYENESKYKAILDLIFAKDYLNNNDLSIPSMKEISSITGIKYTQVSKLIKELYDKLFTYDENFDFSFDFKNVEIIFYCKYFDYYAQFKCKQLAYLPKFGDQIDISFVNAKVGTSMFFVDQIEHMFEGDAQKIYIRLRAGTYNTYLHYRKHKAIEEGEISSDDYYSASDYDLRKLLKIGRFRR